jgi:predicted nucleic acid-binding protein
VTDVRAASGLLDTSVIIDLARLTDEQLPVEFAISAITLAELTMGPLTTDDPRERARRQDRLQRAEATFEPLPFGVDAARAYGRVCVSVLARGRKPRGQRAIDLLIAATALAAALPLYTCNPDDFAQIDGLEVVSVTPGTPYPPAA